MQIELAADPFGIKEAECLVWTRFAESGAVEAILARQDAERADQERDILDRRLKRTYDHAPRSLFTCDTLHYFLGRLDVPVEGVHDALVHWRACFRERNRFMTGRCHEFALVAHEHLGWPMKVAICPVDGWPELAGRIVHVAVETPDGRLFDVEGFKTEEVANPMIRSEPWRHIGVSELMSHIGDGGLAPFTDLTEASAALAAVLGIDVADMAQSSAPEPAVHHRR